jgi:MFS family permease
VTGLVPHSSAVWIGRFITGFASAIPAVVTAGSIEDMFDGKQRVWLVVLWNAGSTAGLCLGPVYGAYIISFLNWRWVFHISAVITGGCFLGLLCVKESRPSRIFKRKIEILRRSGVENLEWFNPDHSPDARTLVRLTVVQPLRLLATEPIVAMVTTISAVSWGIIYLFTESLPEMYLSLPAAGFTQTSASLAFLAFIPGVVLSFLPRLWDRTIVRRRLRRGERIEP